MVAITMMRRNNNQCILPSLPLKQLVLWCMIGAVLYNQVLQHHKVTVARSTSTLVTTTTTTTKSTTAVASSSSNKQQQQQQQQQITVLISTYKQPTCLQQLLQDISKCTVVAAIHVNWFETDQEPPVLSSSSSVLDNKPIMFDKLPDRLSHRFYPREWETDAIFHMDVDTTFSCAALELALHIYQQQDNPYNVVGFDARRLYTNGTYKWSEPYFPPYSFNTLFVTKGAVTHKDVLVQFFDARYQALRDLVDDRLTGEDMLMSFVLQHDYQAQMVFVCLQAGHTCERDCQEGALKGLKSRTANQRRHVLLEYYRHFGDILQHTSASLAWQQNHSSHEWSGTSASKERTNCNPHVCSPEHFV